MPGDVTGFHRFQLRSLKLAITHTPRGNKREQSLARLHMVAQFNALPAAERVEPRLCLRLQAPDIVLSAS